MGAREGPTVPDGRYDAWLFDLDGVITATASIHARAWKEMFDDYLHQRAQRSGAPFVEFDTDLDYRVHVDGKPRIDGVRDFLASRGIELPEGSAEDPPERETVNGLGNRKNTLVREAIERGEVQVFPSSVDFVRRLRERGMKTAVVSSSKNCQAILRAGGIENLFDTRIDGAVAAELGLPGKPAPDTFLAAAERLGVPRERSVVVEDAAAGVQAGRAGPFGLVVGVARTGNDAELLDEGADLVVHDLGDLLG
ncbi:MAG: beta-phosphoglucomutase family hydrolase [Thermoleophilia bacterium]|nr:beta-phosphoglucomutase family hydrolase [Thermoleophilia bacterium]